MRLTDKRFWFLFLVMANVVRHICPDLFSVDKISKDDFEKAKTVSKIRS